MKELPLKWITSARGCQSSARTRKPTTSCYTNVPRGPLGVSGLGSVCSSRFSRSGLLQTLPSALRLIAAQAFSRPFSTPQRPEDPGDSESQRLGQHGCQATSKHLASLNSLRLVSPKFDPGRPGQRCWLRLQAGGAHWPPGQTRPRASPGTATRNRSREGEVALGFPVGFRRAHRGFHAPAPPPLSPKQGPLLHLSEASSEAKALLSPDSLSREPARRLRPQPGT